MRTHIVGRFRANALLLVATTFAVACTDSQSPTPQSPAGMEPSTPSTALTAAELGSRAVVAWMRSSRGSRG
jgi:hypothetical protein